jgi:propionyl-CoA carboxylase alpha chain
MPGVVARLAVAESDAVVAGQPLLWLEAMKMEHAVRAPVDGHVGRLHVTAGEQVAVGTLLATLEGTAVEGTAVEGTAVEGTAVEGTGGPDA